MTNSGTWDATANDNLVEYNGTVQTVVNPNATTAGYHDLILSGSGVKTLPTMAILGNLTMSGTASTTPESSTTVTFSGASPQTISGPSTSPVTLNNLTVSSGSKLTVATGTALTVGGTTTLGGGENLVIATEASFIDNGFAGSGTARVEKNLTGSRWWYLGSAVAAVNATDAFGTLSSTPGQGTRLYRYNEPTAAYVNITSGTLETALRGYSYKKFDGDLTAAFTGALNTGTIGAADNLTRTAGHGFNLVCNPFPSAINWGCANTPTFGLIKTNLETTIWYRTSSTFATYNSEGGGTGVNGGQQYVPAMQAFWVRVATGFATGTLQVPNTARLHNAQTFYKSSAGDNIFRMIVQKDAMNDELAVGFFTGAQSTFENYDSHKMFTDVLEYPQIYTLTADNDIVAINGYPEMQENDALAVPLGFKASVAGTFSFIATNLGVFSPDIMVSIEDKTLNVTQDLRVTNTYSFISGVVNNATRFVLHFNKAQPAVPSSVSLQNNTVLSGQSLCFNATQTITVAGSGTEFTIENGGMVNLVAGRNIVLLPGAKIQEGGYLHAFITENGQYCNSIINNPINPNEVSAIAQQNSLFTIYPNPTAGKFMIRFPNNPESSTSVVHIYNMFGVEVLNNEIVTNKTSELSLLNQPPGIYIIRVGNGSKSGTAKIVKQ